METCDLADDDFLEHSMVERQLPVTVADLYIMSIELQN